MKFLNKFLNLGYLLLFFFLSWQTRYFLRLGKLDSVVWEYKTISLYFTDILIVLLFILFTIWWFRNDKFKKIKLNLFYYLIAAWEFFIIVSIFFAPDPLLALYKYIVFLLGVALFVLFLHYPKNKNLLIKVFLIGIFFQAVLGIFQFLSQESFSFKWLGISAHDSASLGVSVLEVENERWLRAYGGLDHPNILASVLVIATLLSFNLFLKKGLKKKNFLDPFLWLMYLTFITALFFTFSRAAWLALAVSVLVYWFYLFKNKKLIQFRQATKVITVSIFLLAFLFILFKPLALTRITGGSRLEEKSSQQRITQVVQAKEVIKDNIFFGTGIGNYTLNLKEKFPQVLVYNLQPVHNTYLLVLAEIGILGFLCFLIFLIIVVKQVIKSKKEIKLSLLLALLILLFFEHWWWSLHFGVLFLFFNFGLLLDKKFN